MFFAMYAVGAVLIVWQIMCVKEFMHIAAAGWNGVRAKSGATCEDFVANQLQVHEKYYSPPGRWTYKKALLLERFLWLLMEALALAIIHDSTLIPEDWVWITNYAIMAVLMLGFLAAGDYFYDFIRLDDVHRDEEFSEEKLKEFFASLQTNEEHVIPVPALLAYRVLRSVCGIMAIMVVFVL